MLGQIKPCRQRSQSTVQVCDFQAPMTTGINQTTYRMPARYGDTHHSSSPGADGDAHGGGRGGAAGPHAAHGPSFERPAGPPLHRCLWQFRDGVVHPRRRHRPVRGRPGAAVTATPRPLFRPLPSPRVASAPGSGAFPEKRRIEAAPEGAASAGLLWDRFFLNKPEPRGQSRSRTHIADGVARAPHVTRW